MCLCAYVPMCLCAFVPMCLCAYVPMCMCVYAPMWLCAFVPMCLCAYVPMCLCAYVLMCIGAYVPMCVCAYVLNPFMRAHTYIHKCMHAHMHTDTDGLRTYTDERTYIRTQLAGLSVLPGRRTECAYVPMCLLGELLLQNQ